MMLLAVALLLAFLLGAWYGYELRGMLDGSRRR